MTVASFNSYLSVDASSIILAISFICLKLFGLNIIPSVPISKVSIASLASSGLFTAAINFTSTP